MHNNAAANLRLKTATHYFALIEGVIKQTPVLQPFQKLYDQQSAALVAQQGTNAVPQMKDDYEILTQLMIAESLSEDTLCDTHVEDVLLEKQFDQDQLNDGLWQDSLFDIRRIHECKQEG